MRAFLLRGFIRRCLGWPKINYVMAASHFDASCHIRYPQQPIVLIDGHLYEMPMLMLLHAGLPLLYAEHARRMRFQMGGSLSAPRRRDASASLLDALIIFMVSPPRRHITHSFRPSYELSAMRLIGRLR